jgi:hypothetical protein
MSGPSMTAEQIERNISAFAGLLGRTGKTAEEYRLTQRAAAAGEHCGLCDETFAESAVIYRRSVVYPPSGGVFAWATVVAPACETCASLDHIPYLEPVPCQGCGRLVCNETSYRDRRRITCSERCATKALYAEYRHRRAEARGTRVCPICNETFEPPRADAKFCSSPCRQKAYRRHVTDAEQDPGQKCKTRNALRVSNRSQVSRAEAVTVGDAP